MAKMGNNGGNRKNKSRQIKKSLFAQSGQKGGFNSMQVEPGMQGIMAFCSMNKEKQAVAELRNILGEFAEQLYGREHTSDESTINDSIADEESQDVADMLDQELKQLKSEREGKEEQFRWRKTNIDCMVFLQTHHPIDPSDFVYRVLTDLQNKKIKRTRYTIRVHPVQETCRAYMDDIKQLAQRLLSPYFHKEGLSPVRWACEPRIRWNDKIKKDELIIEIANVVGQNHVVNLKQPELTVVIDIFKNICAMAVVRDYPGLKKYNLEKIFEAEQETIKAQQGDDAPKSQEHDGKSVDDPVQEIDNSDKAGKRKVDAVDAKRETESSAPIKKTKV
ncbi:uncharacterized protein SPPG_08110 [Spizellomyces punctatus DAOM BR117]|uniref:THUMP domain-containing protein n=1 Tax=Spizellomyces punctatus (strain DAOM BR117) TaxID=645134 RepID=A0A0L0H5N0_SPIPD|nr:uncharacterized protein SPPG_08110 [Spizellomyces punctatus DAOM BR117]KNC96522.1 hypothetical protein SPPG_08110 [Spizellomyces punctatus DAOM BR117]|eukprot:XP_016604562.1 hypothetical protein SPPG_08110 [Spizellomyces punctatus DAOM BR117]